ncbi:hypothetical protein GNE88_03685 [Trichormus variabilis PNB]|nr:hypothetical protein [Trichormus variabilis]MBC1310130.1 hypothetical protein [Trichormus variabilis PNB]MBD2379944.1 hypothetical protein [Trichormus variabilis FACHB-319]QFZ14306.1 hypothetical protein EH233_21030 [Anabaena sp. YBS01]
MRINVGWVERSETQQNRGFGVGLLYEKAAPTFLNPTYICLKYFVNWYNTQVATFCRRNAKTAILG